MLLQVSSRAINIHPLVRKFQGIRCKFGDEGFAISENNRLCMGLSSSPLIFSKISDFITRCMIRRRLFTWVSRQEVSLHHLRLIHLLRRLGFFINYLKKCLLQQLQLDFWGDYCGDHGVLVRYIIVG